LGGLCDRWGQEERKYFSRYEETGCKATGIDKQKEEEEETLTLLVINLNLLDF
jgi:hypothetical protein